MTIPQGQNQRWSLDFVSDVLAVVDDITHEALALVVDSSIPGVRVVSEVDALMAWRGDNVLCLDGKGKRGREVSSRRSSSARLAA